MRTSSSQGASQRRASDAQRTSATRRTSSSYSSTAQRTAGSRTSSAQPSSARTSSAQRTPARTSSAQRTPRQRYASTTQRAPQAQVGVAKNSNIVVPLIIGIVVLVLLVALIVGVIIPGIVTIVGGGGQSADSAATASPTAAASAEAAGLSADAVSASASSADAEAAEAEAAAAARAAAPPATVSFVAVGDNLPDDYIGYYADSLAGEMDDGLYEYLPMYKHVAASIILADLAYVDQEVHLGGDDIGPQGYPSFNVTDSMADTLSLLGFDFVATATNHSYDWAYDALAHSVSVLDSKGFAFTGTAATQEQYKRIVTQERDGITFALLNYTYGVNSYSESDLPQYAVNFIDDARITSDVQRAHEIADVVLVSMHWGTELLEEADEEQQRLAQLLADLDVDVVLGSHPHVIGPMAWVASSTNPEHRTLVCYSLGNFLADHEAPLPENLVEGMLKCDFVRAETGGEVTVENVEWVPLVCYSTDDRWNFDVYPVEDFPAEMAKQCRTLSDMDDPIGWLMSHSKAVVGEEWF